MPDTAENQAEYPQSTAQAEGLGFPIMRAVALCSLATGMVTALACGPYAGKETGETALLRTLFDTLARGDVVLGDRYYGGWFMLALLQAMGVDFVTRLHQLRTADFKRGRRLGKGDHVVSWPKPERPEWMDQETYDRLPEELEVREIHVNIDVPGFRTESLVVVTSLLDAKDYSRDEISAIYRRRWVVEVSQADCVSRYSLYRVRGTAHSGGRGVAGAGTMEPATPTEPARRILMRRHIERPCPPRAGRSDSPCPPDQPLGEATGSDPSRHAHDPHTAGGPATANASGEAGGAS